METKPICDHCGKEKDNKPMWCMDLFHFSDDVIIPQFIWNCPVFYDWTEYKGETYFAILNYERSITARRPMIDLCYCATKAMNGIVEKTVQYSKKHFKKSKLAVTHENNLNTL
jgi:hypothetical protein